VAVIGVDEHIWRHTRRDEKYFTVIIDLTPVRDGTLPLGQDGVVRGIPRHAQSPGDPGDRKVPDDQTHQGPSAPLRETASLAGRGPRKVLPPHAPTARTAVAPHGSAASRAASRMARVPDGLV